jgi:hypothetical protein
MGVFDNIPDPEKPMEEMEVHMERAIQQMRSDDTPEKTLECLKQISKKLDKILEVLQELAKK